MNAAVETVIPTVPGTPFAGGFYAGRYFIGLDAYALIIAPKAEGEIKNAQWHESLTRVDGALSYNDGLANTIAMAEAGSALAKQIRELRIGGFDDWHLGDRLQMLGALHELQHAPVFASGGAEAFEQDWYWTSAQYAGTSGYAWYQSFGHGHQYYTHRVVRLLARAVRRVTI